jgi:hypothetical protein
MRFPEDNTRFYFGTLGGERGVIVSGGEPTGYGVEVVNGRVYRSWSPEFESDADYENAVFADNHYQFPPGVRGSASNPARIIGCGTTIGGLTNRPAFTAMPAIKCARLWTALDEALRPIMERREKFERFLQELVRREEVDRSRKLFAGLEQEKRRKQNQGQLS